MRVLCSTGCPSVAVVSAVKGKMILHYCSQHYAKRERGLLVSGWNISKLPRTRGVSV